MRALTLALLTTTLTLHGRSLSAQPRAMSLEDGTPVGVLAPPVPSTWRRASEDAPWDTGLWAAGHRGALRVTLGAFVDPPPEPSERAFVVNQVDLATERGAPFVVLYCVEVEPLGPSPHGPRVRVYTRNGLTFEGTVPELPRAVGWGNCPARATSEETFPRFWRRASPDAHARVRLSGSIWWNDGEGCQRWTFRRYPQGLRLERTTVTRTEGNGVLERLTSYHFEGAVEDLSMYAAAVHERWLRRPRELYGSAGSSALGLVMALTFVEATPRYYRWLVARGGLTAFHPADAQTWYRTREACRVGEPRPRRP